MKRKWRKSQIQSVNKGDTSPVPIVADAAIASRAVGEGRLIPLVIVDTSSRPDIDDLVKAHAHLPPGDVETQWGQPPGKKDRIWLVVSFQRPSRCLVILEFDIVGQGILVDQTLRAQALYIQPGRLGDRLRTTMGNPRIIVEVPRSGFDVEWDRTFRRGIAKDLRKRGLGREQAAKASGEAIGLMRKFGHFRVRR